MTQTPKTLTTLECHQLLEALIPQNATHKQHARGVRNRCMALLMLDAGLRVGEVVQLLQTDLLIANQPVEALQLTADITKTHTDRIVPLSDRIRRAIEEMRRTIWLYCLAGHNHFAFYTTTADVSLTVRQVQRIIEDTSEQTIGRAVHPHVLRHTFATRLMRRTNARIVQELLGHKSITSTQVYTHPNEDDKKKAIQQLDPEPVK